MLPIDKKKIHMDYPEGDIYIYVYMYNIYIYIHVEFLASHFSDLSRSLEKFTGWAIIEELSIRRRLCTFFISWGQKTCMLYWFIVVIRILVCDCMYWYEHHFGSFYRNTTILETRLPVNGSIRENLLYWNTMTVNNSSTDMSMLR